MFKKVSMLFVASLISLSFACGGGGGDDCEAVAKHIMKITSGEMDKMMDEMLKALQDNEARKPADA